MDSRVSTHVNPVNHVVEVPSTSGLMLLSSVPTSAQRLHHRGWTRRYDIKSALLMGCTVKTYFWSISLNQCLSIHVHVHVCACLRLDPLIDKILGNLQKLSPKERIIQSIEERFRQAQDLIIWEGHVLLGGEERTVHDYINDVRLQLDRLKSLLQDEVSFTKKSSEDFGLGFVVVTLSFNAKMDLANFECNLND